MMRKVILLTVLMSLVGIKITSSQEWQCGIEWEADALGYYRFLEKPTELSNGNLLVPTKYAFREDVQQQPVATSSPGATLLSDKGQILVQQYYFRPGYCTISLSHTFENNGNCNKNLKC